MTKFDLCWVAARMSQLWDFIDKRDIDKHALAWLTAICGWSLTREMIDLGAAALAAKAPMTEVAAVIAAIGAPYAIFAGAMVKWYFERQENAKLA